jgi:hypothetical protein
VGTQRVSATGQHSPVAELPTRSNMTLSGKWYSGGDGILELKFHGVSFYCNVVEVLWDTIILRLLSTDSWTWSTTSRPKRDARLPRIKPKHEKSLLMTFVLTKWWP